MIEKTDDRSGGRQMIEDFHVAQLVRFGALVGRRVMFDYFQNYAVWILEG
jgi:hypothetical protein